MILFFKDVKVSFDKNKLIIKVTENPLIQEIVFDGVKAKKILN